MASQSYLKTIAVKKRKRETNPDGPEIRPNTHLDQRLISPEEAQEISAILKMNTRLKGGNFQGSRNQRNQHSEFAYQTGLIFCAQCGSRCTSKTAHSGRYAYFACRNAGVGCSNKTSVRKSAIEQVLILHLVAKSQEMQEAVWESRRGVVGVAATMLHATGANDQTVRQFLLDENPRYEDLEKPSSFSPKQTARITELEEQLQDLEKMRHYNPEVERLKQQLQDEIEKSKNASQSLLEKSAGQIVLEGNTSYFWDGLTHEDKTRVFDKIVRKIFIDQGKVTEVLLQHEQLGE